MLYDIFYHIKKSLQAFVQSLIRLCEREKALKIKRFVGGSLESNGYIISNKKEGECYIIDPGYEPAKFINFVEKEKLSLQGIILTHHHHDHVGGAAKIADCFDCPVMMSFEDSLMYKGKIGKYLEDGDKLFLDGEELKIIKTPGHTHGSVCIMSDVSRVVFSGDTIFDTDLGRTDLSDGSDKEMADTCRNIISKWHDSYTVYPGHDGSSTMKNIRKFNSEFLYWLEVR